MSASIAALETPAKPVSPEGGAAASDDCLPPRARAPLPDSPRRLRVGMPQLDAAGLSENWLLRYAGDLQWEAIARHLGVASDEIRGAGGERLYPTVVAVRGRYGAPLAAVQENDVLDARVELVPAGRACAWGRVAIRFGGGSGRSAAASSAAERALVVELLTTFAVRDRAAGTLHMMPPAPSLARRWVAPDGAPPAIARLARAARRGEPLDDAFAGPLLARASASAPLGTVVYEPSPYGDYNGAGLLYFASYATIADSAERQLVHRLGLDREPGGARTTDWALATSAVRRDVYYYDNLPLGAAVTATLVALDSDSDPEAVTTHVRLARADGGRRMADVLTRRSRTRRRS